jgi:hypothetical protein
VKLSVQLTIQPVDIEVEAAPGKPKPLPPQPISLRPTQAEVQEQRIELQVYVSSEGFQVDTMWQKLVLPLGKDSHLITFELVGRQKGEQIVEVEIYHRTLRCGYVVIRSQVAEEQTSGQDAQVIYQNFVLKSENNRPAVLIKVAADTNGLDYHILEVEDTGTRWTDDSQILSKQGAGSAFWADLNDMLANAITFAERKDQIEAIWLELVGLGKMLFQDVLTPFLRQRSAHYWPKGAVILISTNDNWIPWELIYDGDDFWGRKFIIARDYRIPGADAFHESDKPVEAVDARRVHKVVSIVGGNIGSGSFYTALTKRIKNLFAACEGCAEVQFLENANVKQVIDALANADLIHFTCHGLTKPRPCLQVGSDSLPASSLTPITLMNLSHLKGGVVFINSCKSAVVSPFFGELRNFAWEFYKKGAITSIGTFGLMPVEQAVAFAEYFYEHLFAGYPVGEALAYAKANSDQHNPFWLLYSLIGDPFVTKSA